MGQYRYDWHEVVDFKNTIKKLQSENAELKKLFTDQKELTINYYKKKLITEKENSELKKDVKFWKNQYSEKKREIGLTENIEVDLRVKNSELKAENERLAKGFDKVAELAECKRCKLQTGCPMYATQDGCTERLKQHFLKEVWYGKSGVERKVCRNST